MKEAILSFLKKQPLKNYLGVLMLLPVIILEIRLISWLDSCDINTFMSIIPKVELFFGLIAIAASIIIIKK